MQIVARQKREEAEIRQRAGQFYGAKGRAQCEQGKRSKAGRGFCLAGRACIVAPCFAEQMNAKKYAQKTNKQLGSVDE